jgi:hypothetical protein
VYKTLQLSIICLLLFHYPPGPVLNPPFVDGGIIFKLYLEFVGLRLTMILIKQFHVGWQAAEVGRRHGLVQLPTEYMGASSIFLIL